MHDNDEHPSKAPIGIFVNDDEMLMLDNFWPLQKMLRPSSVTDDGIEISCKDEYLLIAYFPMYSTDSGIVIDISWTNP